MSLSNYGEAKILNHVFCGQESTFDLSSNDLYIGLATSLSADGDTLAEVSTGTGYARVKIADQTTDSNNVFAPITIDGSETGSITTDAQITFASASGGDWGTVTHIGIWDASASGNLVAWGELSVDKTITDGDTFIISSGSLTVTLD